MHALVNIALRAARDAAEALAHSSDRLDRVKIIDENPASFLTSQDLEADKTILYHLRKSFPDHSIISRVSGEHPGEKSNNVWLIDPLLGNRNFAAGYGQFGVGIACQIEGVVQHAVVVCPMVREEFSASRGHGAQLNSRRLRVDQAVNLEEALITVDDYGIAADTFLGFQRQLLEAGGHPRMSGCAPLDMLQAACGRVHGGWCSGIIPPTLAASRLILQEAGGLLGSDKGNPDLASASEILFANPRLYKSLLKLRKNS